jgi:hypothetical protein
MSQTLATQNLYDQWKILSPDNVLMCRVSQKRATWYLSRELADLIDTKTIKLRFTPGGLGHHGLFSFMLEDRLNQCVVCGADSQLTKHHVIPHQYRKHFPVDRKARTSYDVLMVCHSCHETYEKQAGVRNRELMDEMNIRQPKIEVDYAWLNLCKMANALLAMRTGTIRGSLPPEKQAQYEQMLCEYLNVSLLTDEQLASFSAKKTSREEFNRGEVIMRQVLAQGKLDKFCADWRKHFMLHMQPKFIPSTWNIYHV